MKYEVSKAPIIYAVEYVEDGTVKRARSSRGATFYLRKYDAECRLKKQHWIEKKLGRKVEAKVVAYRLTRLELN